MAINWDRFISNIADWSQNKNRTNTEYVLFLTNQYDLAIKTGQQLSLPNAVITGNKISLGLRLAAAFEIGMRIEGTNYGPLNDALASALESYWTSALLALTAPPPGAVSVISNVVLNIGICPSVTLAPSENPGIIAEAIVDASRQHLLTISGLTTGASPTGTPIPFPWTGYL